MTAAVRETAGDFAADLETAVLAARAGGVVSEELANLPVEAVTPELIEQLAGELMGNGMSEVNRLLDASPPPLREAFLRGFLSHLQRPSW